MLGAVGLAFASRGTADWLLCLALMPFGAGCGSAFANATELTLGAVAPERAASAAAISESAFEFGGVLGVAVLSTLLGASALAPEALQLAGQRAFWAGALALLLAWSVAASLLVQRNP